jgi:hypothetical protein
MEIGCISSSHSRYTLGRREGPQGLPPCSQPPASRLGKESPEQLLLHAMSQFGERRRMCHAQSCVGKTPWRPERKRKGAGPSGKLGAAMGRFEVEEELRERRRDVRDKDWMWASWTPFCSQSHGFDRIPFDPTAQIASDGSAHGRRCRCTTLPSTVTDPIWHS